jgi:hypothetical protein
LAASIYVCTILLENDPVPGGKATVAVGIDVLSLPAEDTVTEVKKLIINYA